MLIREAAPDLRLGAYVISVGPEAAALPYDHLRTVLVKALRSIESL
jgi:hypothetical protein